MAFYLGGFRVVAAGRLSPRAVYLDFDSDDVVSYWQLYSDRVKIGATNALGQRRVSGQLLPEFSPAPLSLVRVDADDLFTDFGADLPLDYECRFELLWTSSGSTNVDHWDVVTADAVGGDPNLANVLGKVAFTADGNYSFQLDPVALAGTWKFAVVPRDAANNAGTPIVATIVVAMPPPDVTFRSDKKRFAATSTAGTVTVSFTY